ncbi:class I SAM-dependent methyltransferase [Gloeothece verrucosa]|uniref:class I SAM-dependent methyltransferase n=1 Tax=Gloeothece verrucosa TaxID=2546359 RepID=UPI0005A555F8|nr:class I SAM-dependent methyltransferase [Gloeothece verrucosa]
MTNNKEYFRDAWSIYEQVTALNYMEHQDIYEIVHQYIVKNYREPFSFLELGCGDARYSAKALLATAISNYTGVDLSLGGLNLAPKNLKNINCIVELKQQEMSDFLESCNSSFDLILISFALHHLSSKQKQVFLQQCWNCLNSKGTLLLIDVFCRNQETLPEYLARYCGHIQTQWQQIPSQSISKIVGHISTSDYPESESTLRHWAQEIGFNQVKLIYDGKHDVHKAFALIKNS